MKSGFDRLATPYRWLEYLSFGRALERCRCRFMTEMADTRSALLLGDGDGRFAASLLLAAPLAHVEAVDESAAMLAALSERCTTAGVCGRVTLNQADLTRGVPALRGAPFDLVVTHFFLDCLSERDTAMLVDETMPMLDRNARWVVSEFNIPHGPMHVPARIVVWILYAAFRLLTGLRAQQLPNHAAILRRRGFTLKRYSTSLRGLLRSEVWACSDGITRR